MGLPDDLKNEAATQQQQEQLTQDKRSRNLRAVDTALHNIQNDLIAPAGVTGWIIQNPC